MSKSLVEIQGFKELQTKLKKLGNDKDKRKEVLKILRQVANPTKNAAKQLAPKHNKRIVVRGKYYIRKYRRVGKTVVQWRYTTGFAEKSIGIKTLRRANNPMLVVRPRDIAIGGKKKYGGWYVRQMLIRGTKYIKANPFLDKAYQQTKGLVTADAERKVARYMQKQINRLSK